MAGEVWPDGASMLQAFAANTIARALHTVRALACMYACRFFCLRMPIHGLWAPRGVATCWHGTACARCQTSCNSCLPDCTAGIPWLAAERTYMRVAASRRTCSPALPPPVATTMSSATDTSTTTPSSAFHGDILGRQRPGARCEQGWGPGAGFRRGWRLEPCQPCVTSPGQSPRTAGGTAVSARLRRRAVHALPPHAAPSPLRPCGCGLWSVLEHRLGLHVMSHLMCGRWLADPPTHPPYPPGRPPTHQ